MSPPAPYLPDNGLEPLAKETFWLGLRAHGAAHRSFRDAAFSAFSERGAYPLAHTHPDTPWPLIADQLNETVIKRVIQHDLRLGEKGRKRDARLLEELFRICCREAGQAPSVQKIATELRDTLDANIGPARVRTYLRFLADTLLVRLISPAEIRLKRHRSNEKICLTDHGLRASWLQDPIPVDPEVTGLEESVASLAGYQAESIVGATLSCISGLDLAWLPEKGPDKEIDFILQSGLYRIPIEVKYRNTIRREHVEGLLQFVNKKANQAPFGILITKYDLEIHEVPDKVIPVSLRDFMLLR